MRRKDRRMDVFVTTGEQNRRMDVFVSTECETKVFLNCCPLDNVS
jgi:hypothetical protein